MTTDLTVIRNALKHCEEITLPYKFTKDSWIKYITVKGEDEAFYEGGLFSGMGNQRIYLTNGKSKMHVPTCIKSDDGEIIYRPRFFIDPTKQSECEVNKQRLDKTVAAQQRVIDKLAEQLKLAEESKQQVIAEHYEVVALCQDKEQEVKQLQADKHKYKLLLSQYIQ